MSIRGTKKSTLILLTSALCGALGFVGTTAMGREAPVAAFCDDMACDPIGDCYHKVGWSCTTDPCINWQCAVT